MRIVALLLVSAGLVTGAARSQSSDCPCPCPPAADTDTGDPGTASISYFHQQLSPYGRWVDRVGYGQVWVPYVAAGWRPYTTGHWVYTDQGWAWVADESWGWAPFHYGRWFYADGGWGWVPGTVWAPAWVAWRNGGGYVGWAALPPAVGFSFGVGVVFGGVDLNVAIAPAYYSFVSERAILEPRLATVIVAPERNVTIIKNTTNITNYTVVNNRVVNNGVSVQRIQQVTGRPVPRVSTANQVGLYQPPVIARAARVTKAESFTNRSASNPLGRSTIGAGQMQAGGRGTTGTGTASTQPRSFAAGGRNRTTGTTGISSTTTGSGRHRTTGTTGTMSATTGTGRHRTTGTTGTSSTTTGTGHYRRTTGTTGTAGTSSTSGGGGHRRTTGSTGASSATTGTGRYHTTGTGGLSSTGPGTTGSHSHGQTRSTGAP
ncbi:MAG TPA: DUF6600 domain-containing protein, partial [Thermoanaerobaculia bacterium]|nr:DUF6600 domain-containing protein [Thermoanaerobaculia bacterium]